MRYFSISNWGKSIRHHWGILLLSFLLICGVGIPAIWFLIEPLYTVTGAIRVAPVFENIVTGETDSGGISKYQSFMNTQAEMITSSNVMQRVADDLIDKNFSFFKDPPTPLVTKISQKLKNIRINPEPAAILKQAISAGIIAAAPAPDTELLKVTMKSTKPEEAKQIVDAFIRAYMLVEVSSSTQEQRNKLQLLEAEQKLLLTRLNNHRSRIRELAQGTTLTMADQQGIMLQNQRVSMLLSELARLDAHRISLETQVELLEQFPEQDQGIEPEEMLIKRRDYINSDPTVQRFSQEIIQLECDLIITKQTLQAGEPTLKQKQELIDTFQSHLEEKRQKVGEEFDTIISKETANASKQKLRAAKAELEQTKIHEKRLQELLAEEDTQTPKVGRTQLDTQDLQFQFDLDKEMYDTVLRRIQVLEMEQKRPARVSVAYYADIGPIRDRRIIYTIALIFGAMVCGMLSVFLREKAQ